MKICTNDHEVITLDDDRRITQACYSKTDLVEQISYNTEVNLDIECRYELDSSDDEVDDTLTKELKTNLTGSLWTYLIFLKG